MKSFGLIQESNNIEFINLYSADNPLLETGDECFFLLFNLFDFHRPMIVKGKIIKDIFSDQNMSKTYYVKISELLEAPNTLDKFFWDKQFATCPIIDGVVRGNKTININKNTVLDNFTIKVEAFFARKNIEKIAELQIDYINIIQKDLKRQLQDISDF